MSNDTPKVIGAPDVMWVNYGELDEDTHHETLSRAAESGLPCCEEQLGISDVMYVREDIAVGLLEALKDCTKELNYPEIDPLVWPTLHKAYRAIAKAEGVLDE